jgi:2-polyprenyl-3-methyl-5-hydroxy-6-metoxy-1,4-benzoquinol methylase
VSGHPAVLLRDAAVHYDGYYGQAAPPAPEARYEEWLARAEAEVGRGRLLEVGAGVGGLVRVAMRRGWSVDATEVSPLALQALRATGATVFAGPVEEAGYAGGRFDLVVSLEVLEHLPDPLVHLRELARVTRAGGLLLLTTPNFGGLSRRWLGLGWRVVDPEHLGYFTARTLSWALKEAGYGRVRTRARSLDISTWLRGGRGQVAAFDPHAAARVRDGVQSSATLRAAKEAVNVLLGATGLGDTLLTWARR